MNHPLSTLAPSSATLKFNNQKFLLDMSTMGIFKTAIIGDNEKKTIAQTVKFLDIKQACIDDENAIKEENGQYVLKFTETKETKMIAGLKCHKVIAEFVNEPGKTFDVYYTKELGMPDCNILTPYFSIKGILMDYRLKRMGLELRFVAKKYRNEEVPLSVFEIPAYMKIISKQEMEEFFKSIQ
ncbi:MAG: hypothetical protein N3F09_04600 [Bacteroidia bacterium]|nr:hypothetical protein [Bacteroidia bacterium]